MAIKSSNLNDVFKTDTYNWLQCWFRLVICISSTFTVNDEIILTYKRFGYSHVLNTNVKDNDKLKFIDYKIIFSHEYCMNTIHKYITYK